ncbi:hypothetical protein IAT38_002324 [Cryptococcus sp. DSM 104549]
MRVEALLPVVGLLALSGSANAAPAQDHTFEKKWCLLGFIGNTCGNTQQSSSSSTAKVSTTSTSTSAAKTSTTTSCTTTAKTTAATSTSTAKVSTSSAVTSSSSAAKTSSTTAVVSAAKAASTTASVTGTATTTADWSKCTDFDWSHWSTGYSWGGGYSLNYVKSWYADTYGLHPPSGMSWNQVSSLVDKFGAHSTAAGAKASSSYSRGCSNPWTSAVATTTAASSTAKITTTAAASSSTSKASSSASSASASASASKSSAIVSASASSTSASASKSATSAAATSTAAVTSSTSVSTAAPTSTAAASSASSSSAAAASSSSAAAASSASSAAASSASSAAASSASSAAASSASSAAASSSADVTSTSVATSASSAAADASTSAAVTATGTSDAATGVVSSSTSSSAAAATTTASIVVNGYTSGGCVQEVSGRLLASVQTSGSAMTIESCTATCLSYGFQVAGVEYGNECYCGTTDDLDGALVSGQCYMPCAGDSTEICGGPNAINVFINTDVEPASVVLPTGWYTYGVVGEGVGGRALTYTLWSSSSNTIESCAQGCADLGYTISGTEYSSECYCGNSFSNGGGTLLDSSAAFMACSGDLAQMCGGPSLLSVVTSITGTIPSS